MMNGVPSGFNGQPIRIDANQLDSFECECGTDIFSMGMQFKFIPPLLSPAGKLQPMFLQNWLICANCGKVHDIKTILEEYTTASATIVTSKVQE